MEGTIFDIKEFALYDGPGVRATVFLKGCPLRCRWCHNPEGLLPEPQLMVSAGACTHCGACAAHCTHEACVACGACIPYCKAGLRRIAGKRWTDQALSAHLLRGADLLRESEGGVTFSGGEPLMQWAFVKAVVQRLQGLNTAVETSGYCADEVFEDVLQTVDYVMLDVKQVDPALHRIWCGVDNAPILRHARRLAKADTPYVLRVPLIPGVSDTPEHLAGVAALCEGAKALAGVELLPYHKTAGAKYSMLGMRYEPGFDPERAVRATLAPFEDRGVPVRLM